MYLLQGMEPEERVKLLLSLTKITSEPVCKALVDYLSKGFTESEVVMINEVTQSNFNRALSTLEKVANTVEAIKEIDLHHLKSVK